MNSSSWSSFVNRVYKLPQSRYMGSRFLSSGTRDVRLAGRRRFYKDVGVEVVSPPWMNVDANSYLVPGGAGVDGTDSAIGISLEKPTVESMRDSLDPYRVSSWYTVTLDTRPILTPLGTPLSLPSLPLALAVAVEWSNQLKHLQPTQMPLTTICCTALDQFIIPSVRAATADKLLGYLKTDTTCFWADPLEDRILYRKQAKAWKGLHDWASRSKVGGLRSLIRDPVHDEPFLDTTTGIGCLTISSTKGSKGLLRHSPQAMNVAKEFLLSLDAWRLSAFQAVTMEAKSFLIGMALIQGMTNLSHWKEIPFADDTAKAIAAARVEEECQIESWGLVEGGHDYDRLNCSIQIHSAVVLSSCITAIKE